MERIKKCQSCGVEYSAKSGKSKFCSTKCKTQFYKKQKQKTRVCEICGKEFLLTSKTKTCSKECKEKYKKLKQDEANIKNYIKRKIKEVGIEEYNKLPKCLLCTDINYHADELCHHVNKRHGMTMEEYRKKFNLQISDTMSERLLKIYSEKFKGKNNPGYQHGGKLSPWSSKFYEERGYDKTESEKLAQSKLKESIENRDRENLSTCIEYYTSKGYTEEQSKKLLSQRQTTFSKEICIEKYGEEEGIKRWEERQKKWLKILDDKSDAEKKRINRLKACGGSSISTAERSLFAKIKEFYPETQHQFIINSDVGFVYDIRYKNIIIEYNGDYWHCNPKIYQPDYYNSRIKMFAEEKWLADDIKIDYAQSMGYSVLVVWERDYKKSADSSVLTCLKFIKDHINSS